MNFKLGNRDEEFEEILEYTSGLNQDTLEQYKELEIEIETTVSEPPAEPALSYKLKTKDETLLKGEARKHHENELYETLVSL